MIDIATLQWIPVIVDGHEKLKALPEVLREAHAITDLGGSLLPIEREAVLRLLESAAAEVLRGQNPHDLADQAEDEGAHIGSKLVDAFVDRYRGLLLLDDPERPFLQEWHIPHASDEEIDSKKFNDLNELHLRTAGDSSAYWGITPERRDAHTPAVLALLLTVSWFHGKPSNSDGADFYRSSRSDGRKTPIAGAPSGASKDTVLHLIGDTLAQTLLLNIPPAWLIATAPPAWLDQDLIPDHGQWATPATLWRSTWTPSRAWVAWSGEIPRRVTRGLTNRFIPPVAEVDTAKDVTDQVKDHVKTLTIPSYARAYYPDAKDETHLKTVLAPFELRSTEGYERWFRTRMNTHVHTWVVGDRLIGLPMGVRVGMHNEVGDTYGNRDASQWVTYLLDEIAPTGEAGDALIAGLEHIAVISNALRCCLMKKECGLSSKRVELLRSTAGVAMFSSFDALVIAAVETAGRGEVLDTDTFRQQLNRLAVNSFDVHIVTAVGSNERANIYRARAAFTRTIRATTTHTRETA